MELRKRNWGKLCAACVKKQSLGLVPDPSFRTPDLLCRLPDSSFEPATPIKLKVSRGGELAVLVGEDKNVIPEYHQQVTYFLAN